MPTRKQNYENQQAFKRRMNEQGFTQVSHWIPVDKKDLCKDIARTLREGGRVLIIPLSEVERERRERAEVKRRNAEQATRDKAVQDRYRKAFEAATRPATVRLGYGNTTFQGRIVKDSEGPVWHTIEVVFWWDEFKGRPEFHCWRKVTAKRRTGSTGYWKQSPLAYNIDDLPNESAEKAWSSLLHGDEARDTLGVPADATKAEIKAAWKRYAGQHHPDKGGDPDVFKKGRAAYEVLR